MYLYRTDESDVSAQEPSSAPRRLSVASAPPDTAERPLDHVAILDGESEAPIPLRLAVALTRRLLVLSGLGRL
jgi:hypothetical protein